MDRKEFLAMLGVGAASLIASTYLNGCSPAGNPVSAPSNVDFTLDLTAAANAALNANGGYIYNAGVIVARISANNFVAVSAACTHQGQNVKFTGSQFYCSAHGSSFSTNGTRLAGPANAPLTQYQITITGTSIRVYS